MLARVCVCCTSGSHKSYRPVTTASYRFNYWLFGLEPAAYHCTNIALHAATAATFCYLVYTMVPGTLPSLVSRHGREQLPLRRLTESRLR